MDEYPLFTYLTNQYTTTTRHEIKAGINTYIYIMLMISKSYYI